MKILFFFSVLFSVFSIQYKAFLLYFKKFTLTSFWWSWICESKRARIMISESYPEAGGSKGSKSRLKCGYYGTYIGHTFCHVLFFLFMLNNITNHYHHQQWQTVEPLVQCVHRIRTAGIWKTKKKHRSSIVRSNIYT